MQPGPSKGPHPVRGARRDAQGLRRLRDGKAGEVAELDQSRRLGVLGRQFGQSGVEGDEVVRPEAVSVHASKDGVGTVESVVRTGPLVRLRVALDDGRVLEAAVAGVDHPTRGDRVDVTVDPEGIVRLR